MAIRLMGKAGFSASAAGRQAAADLREERCRRRYRHSSCTNCSTSATTSASADICFARALANSAVHVEEITFLSKDLLPLPIGKAIEGDASTAGAPKKWNELADVELRYRPALR
jgi:hypothetical protein